MAESASGDFYDAGDQWFLSGLIAASLVPPLDGNAMAPWRAFTKRTFGEQQTAARKWLLFSSATAETGTPFYERHRDNAPGLNVLNEIRGRDRSDNFVGRPTKQHTSQPREF